MTPTPLDRETENRISFISFLVLEFAESFKMEPQKAYRYLKQYGGMDFLFENWWALHTDNPFYAVQNLFDICRQNGGPMR
jgi:hypothetical protein